MPTDELGKSDPLEGKIVFLFADFSYITLLLVMCALEYAFIKDVWLKPGPTINLALKIPLQALVLMPAIAGVKARVKMGKKLNAGEISPSYTSDFSFWIVFLLCTVYLTFMCLVAFIPR